MRIESLSYYKYFFQLIRKEPLQLKRYSLFLILIPLLVTCFLLDWNMQVLLFIILGYASAVVGFFTGQASKTTSSNSLKKQFYHQLVTENMVDPVFLVNNQEKRITYVNDAFYRILDLSPQTILDIRFKDFLDGNAYRKVLEAIARSNRMASALNIESPHKKNEIIEFQKENGEQIKLQFSAKTVGDHEDFTLFKFNEMTQEVKQEKAMIQFAKDLVQRRRNTNKNLRIVRGGQSFLSSVSSKVI